jgi:hypothetical protein
VDVLDDGVNRDATMSFDIALEMTVVIAGMDVQLVAALVM